MRITILGSGFGLYGYLPALLRSCQASIILPVRYQDYLLSRPDISHFNHHIEWVDDQESILRHCQGVIIALSPEQQCDWIKKCLKQENITHYFLEKPLANSPTVGADLLVLLKSSGKKFRIGYNFRYTDWGKALLTGTRKAQAISWHFRAHHYANNIPTWKRVHEKGGGALRFYGIHLIALLAEAGYQDVSFSRVNEGQPGEAQDWEAELTGADLPSCKLSVATNSDKVNFLVQNSDSFLYSDVQPFQTKQQMEQGMDKRIPFLVEGLKDLFNKAERYYDWYERVNLLWHNIETFSS